MDQRQSVAQNRNPIHLYRLAAPSPGSR